MDEFNEREFDYFCLQLGTRIGYYRRKAGLTQTDLAEKTGLALSTIGQLESPNMVYVPSLQTLYKLCCVFGVDLKRLVDVDD